MKWNVPPKPSQNTKSTPWRGTAAVRRSGVAYNTDWNTDRAINEAMDRVTWVYRCVDAIAGNAARMELVVREDNPWDGPVVEADPLYRLLNSKSNPGEDSFTFRYRLSAQLLLSRKGVFVQVIRNNGGDPIALYLLSPESVEPIKDTKELVSGWKVRTQEIVNGVIRDKEEKLDREEVIWIRRPHPFDPYGAMTPLRSAGLAIEMDWLAKLYNRNFLINDGRPGGIVVVKGDMEQDDKEELRARFSGGVARAGRISVLSSDQGADFVDTAVNPRDAQYQESRQITKDEILMGFGVPESVLANASGRTFDNAEQERLVFWQETMVQHLDLITRPLDVLDGNEDTFLGYNLSRVDVLQRAEMKRREYILREFDAGTLDVNEYREATGRDPIPGERGKIMWIPRTKKMAAMSDGSDFPMEAEVTNTPQQDGPGRPPNDSVEESPENENERDDERLPELDNTETVDAGQTTAEGSFIEVKGEQIDSVKSTYDLWATIAETTAKRFIERMERVVSQKVDGPKFRSAYYRDASPQDLTELAFAHDTWIRQLSEDMLPVARGAYEDGNGRASKMLGVEAKDAPQIRMSTKLVYEISEVIEEVISKGGEPNATLAAKVRDAINSFGDSQRLTDFCKSVVISAYNQGVSDAASEAGCEKLWVAFDGASLAQQKLHGQISRNGDFQLGRKTLSFPGGTMVDSVIVPVQNDIPVI